MSEDESRPTTGLAMLVTGHVGRRANAGDTVAAGLKANGSFLLALETFLASPEGQALETALVNMIIAMISKSAA
jgi:hypothetical protein